MSPITPKTQDLPHYRYPSKYLSTGKVRGNCSEKSWLTKDSGCKYRNKGKHVDRDRSIWRKHFLQCFLKCIWMKTVYRINFH